MAKIDPEEYQKRLDRMTEIFADMARHADAVSMTRCPYKNRFDRCTAQFGCRFKRPDDSDDLPLCTNDGTLDYRSAWETNPESAKRMKAKLQSRRKN